jgi:hypothetical protein
MKRTGILLVLVLMLAAGNVSAHDKGDMVLNIEPYMGVAFPSLMVFFENSLYPGIDYALRAIVDYYFTDFFALNAGLGYGGNYHLFMNVSGGPQAIHIVGLTFGLLFPPLIPVVLKSAFTIDVDGYGDFFASYITIPIGLRLSPKHFTMGAGATINIPVYGSGHYDLDVKKKSDVWYGTGNEDVTETVTFKLLPYMGWYIDIGADSLGQKGKKVNYGMLFRLSGSFRKEIAEPSSRLFKNPRIEVEGPIGGYKFNFVSASLLFRINIGLANIPIRKKQASAAELVPTDTELHGEEGFAPEGGDI